MERERERGALENKRLRGWESTPQLIPPPSEEQTREWSHPGYSLLSNNAPHGGESTTRPSQIAVSQANNVCFCFKSLSFGMVCYAANDRLNSTLPHFDLTGKFALWFYISTQIHKGRTTLISDTGYTQREKMLIKKTAELGCPVSLKLNQII